jgi:hypothetical protein
MAFDLICATCRQDVENEGNLRLTCPVCFEGVQEDGSWNGFAGQPEVKERESVLRFHHERVTMAIPGSDRILDIQPVAALDRNLWIAITRSGQLVRLDLDEPSVAILCQPSESGVDLASDVSLTLSPDGRLAAVTNTRGRHGVVVDLVLGRETMRLDRGDYHEEHCNFPVAFFKDQGRSLLVHGTDWNRVDISDPATATLLTQRSFAPWEQGKERPEHYLDYFHCGLTLSPTHEYVADNGWVWHPVGVVATWSLRRWLHDNAWESEDGESKLSLCWRGCYWDGPLCWVGEDRLAVWGLGQDAEWLLPAVRIFDVTTGKEERWFPGPKGNLVFDRYLFSFDKDEGTSAWDVDTGERLLRDASFCPLRYQQGTKAFLTPLPDGSFQLSTLRGKAVDPSWLTWNGGTVIQLAQAIHADHAFDRLPILADALEDAGCQDAEILHHCRQPSSHGKRCWVVDAVLAQE